MDFSRLINLHRYQSTSSRVCISAPSGRYYEAKCEDVPSSLSHAFICVHHNTFCVLDRVGFGILSFPFIYFILTFVIFTLIVCIFKKWIFIYTEA